MKTILILTDRFPFLPGEQFIEDEILYWAGNNGFKVILVPTHKVTGRPRTIPENVKIDLRLSKRSNRFRYLWLAKALTSTILAKEIHYLYTNKKISKRSILKAVSQTITIYQANYTIKKIISDASIDIVYNYWNDIFSYATCLAKRQHKVSIVISRAHGSDLYEERQLNKYTPLKRQFIADFDQIYLLSKSAKQYFQTQYNVTSHNLSISPLGVTIPLTYQPLSLEKSNKLHIISVSYCRPIKRVEIIQEAILLIATQLDNIKIIWTHIGSGSTFKLLNNRADILCKKHKNLEIRLLGELSNYDVKQYYEHNDIHIFVNASLSEGTPVSIMEAMSYSIPTVAPNIGGVPTLVSEDRGHLLKPCPQPEDIAKGILTLYNNNTYQELRKRSFEHIKKKFNAKLNYQEFINRVSKIKIDKS